MIPVSYSLRDINPDLIEAWRTCFGREENIDVSCGDIFEHRADAIVSPANSFGFMDGGIDLVYSRRFGWDLQARLQRLLQTEHDGELPVGQAVILETLDSEIPFLISAPTMRVPMNVADTVNAYLAFRAVLRTVKQHNRTAAQPIRSVLCPGLGTAVGRMPPKRCARQMAAAYFCAEKGQTPVLPALGMAVDLHFRLLA
ncbi:MAG: macro domain-containing protein [Myxococcales bacterium]|jgi:O-acetyl-ADP-ribose deacetylase (regulator of RNase III)|nr:macro domain-containing protein [Myxococcales bacterium]